MKTLKFFINLTIASLLILVGSMAQYKYNIVQYLPFDVPVGEINSDLSPKQLSKLMNTAQPSEFQDVDFAVFWQAWQLLEDNYVDQEKIDPAKMVDGAVAGMTAALGDPYTAYLPQEDKVRTGQDLAGAFYGVGIELGYVDGVLAVVAPLDGTPAGNANVEAGDMIIRVKDEQKGIDEDSSGWSLSHAVDQIRGPRNSEVTLTLFRKNNGNEPFEVTLMRDEIVVKSVELSFEDIAEKRIAHIKLSRFGERTFDEWDDAVTEILAERANIDGVVLDMRNNPGGFFDGAIKVASDFIPSGVVVSQKGRFSEQSYPVEGQARLKNMPLVVLVNGGSASASEIVAGALRDQLQTPLVGQKTFGKGTVQDRRDLANGGAVHVTIARWVMPNGEWIHNEGIPVDVEVKDDPETEIDEMLVKAAESLS